MPPSSGTPKNSNGTDQNWLEKRKALDPLRSPISIYEVHVGSWRKKTASESLGYRDLARPLVEYVKQMGFTHVEFMPLAEHAFYPSWGYQVTGFYAPTSRYGTPEDLKFLINALHEAGIGVLIDWVPAHFPRDDWALANFDGTALYEHADPRKGAHQDWGTLIFNFGRHEVSNFLTANALFWCDQFHIDGLRVDAVASMLYLDYSRKEGEWIPNQYGGRENLEAIDFLRKFNHITHVEFPGVITVAEESTAWPLVTRPPYLGGLGFSFKWNMGWMHDTLNYFTHESIHRKYHQNDLTFAMLYHFHENFILPLSHDEVVHGKHSLLGRMPGDDWQRFANLRALLAYQWLFPGKKLMFMGGEIGQSHEWNANGEIDWWLLGAGPYHRGMEKFVADLNKLYVAQPGLWQGDFDHAGFYWIDCTDQDSSILSFVRQVPDGTRQVAVILNLTPVPRHKYRVGFAPRLRQMAGGLEQRRRHLRRQQRGKSWRRALRRIQVAQPNLLGGIDLATAERGSVHAGINLIVWVASVASAHNNLALGPRSNSYSEKSRFKQTGQNTGHGGFEIQAVFKRFDNRFAKRPALQKFIELKTLEGFIRPSRAKEVEAQLMSYPADFLKGLRAVFILSGTTKQLKSWNSGKSYVGHYWNACVFLHAYPFGRRNLDWLRRFYLRDVLTHEIGHHVDTWNETPKDRERFAEWFAQEHG